MISLSRTTLLELTILKIFFSSNHSISFCSDIENRKSPNLFGFIYILDFPWLFSAIRDDAKSIDIGAYIINADIKKTYARNAYISNTYALHTWLECVNVEGACINDICAKKAFVGGVRPRILIRSEVILVGLGVNNCYFILFIRFIFTSINSTYYYSIGIWVILTTYTYLKYSLLVCKK